MSSNSSALTSPATQWTMDIPSLTNMIARMGAEGLKKLALAGVDLHTVGCILTLEPLTPASFEFRSALQRTRQQQRSKSWFVHIVEYGSGVNYFADQLLKTRAGENVLALFTSILPVIDGYTARQLLEQLYQELKVPSHSTPSLHQLEAVRMALLPLARGMGFQERVAEMHFWLLGQFRVTSMPHENGRVSQPHQDFTSECLPDQRTPIKLITELSRLSLQLGQVHKKLQFLGIQGSAWLVVYSSFVLGLPTCLVHSDGSIHPVNAEYEAAQVLIYPWTNEESRVLVNTVSPGDVIYMKVRPNSTNLINMECLLTCGEGGVNILNLMCGWEVQEHQEIGSMVHQIATEYLERHYGNESSPTSFIPFYISEIDAVKSRLPQILAFFGCPSLLSPSSNWRQRFALLDTQNLDLREDLCDSMGWVATPGQYLPCEHPRLHMPSANIQSPNCPRCALHHCIARLSFAAFCLAFTDWTANFRKLSAAMLDRVDGELSQHCLNRLEWLHPQDTAGFEPAIWDSSTRDRAYMAYGVLLLCKGNDLETHNFLRTHIDYGFGWNFDGVMLMETTVITTRLDASQRFKIAEGEFRLDGACRLILSGAPRTGVTGPSQALSYSDGCPRMNWLSPFDYHGGGALEMAAELRRDSIMFTCWYNSGNKSSPERIFISILSVLDTLQNLQVSRPCSHDPRTALYILRYDTSTSRWIDSKYARWQLGNAIGGLSPHLRFLFCMYPASMNPTAQWTSLAFSPGQSDEDRDPVILQRGACLRCIRNRFIQFHSRSPGNFDEPERMTAICHIVNGERLQRVGHTEIPRHGPRF